MKSIYQTKVSTQHQYLTKIIIANNEYMSDRSHWGINKHLPKEQQQEIIHKLPISETVLSEKPGYFIQSSQMTIDKFVQNLGQKMQKQDAKQTDLQTQKEQDDWLSARKQDRKQSSKDRIKQKQRSNFNRDNSYKAEHNGESQYNQRSTNGRRGQINRQNIDISNQQNRLQNTVNQNLAPFSLAKAWPSCGYLIFGRKLSINLRKVQYFDCKILVVPYRNLNLDYYPGDFVLSSNVDYRIKLKAKNESLQRGGSIYVQKASKLGKYQALLFIKINQISREQNLQTGLTYFMKIASSLQKEKPLDTLVFPLSKDLCQAKKIVEIFDRCLNLYTTIKQVHITTSDAILYQKCLSDYNNYMVKLISQNELSFD